jgi:hypothetical protein
LAGVHASQPWFRGRAKHLTRRVAEEEQLTKGANIARPRGIEAHPSELRGRERRATNGARRRLLHAQEQPEQQEHQHEQEQRLVRRQQHGEPSGA